VFNTGRPELAVKGTTIRVRKLYCDRSIITNRTVHYNRLDRVILDETIKEACSKDVAIPSSYNLHTTIIKKLQKYVDLKEVLIRMWQLRTACIIPLLLSTAGIISISNKYARGWIGGEGDGLGRSGSR
jgi:hypothetical protein